MDAAITFLVVTPRALTTAFYSGPPTPGGIPYSVNVVRRPRLRSTTHRVPRVYPFTNDQQDLSYGEYQAQAPYQCETTSPDGSKIAFYRQYDDGRGAGGFGLSSGVICVMNADRTDERELTQKGLNPRGGDASTLSPCPKPNYPY